MGLQNQQFSLTPPYEGINFTALVRWRTFTNIVADLDDCRGPVYFYSLGSSIGSSPHPCHWERMIGLYGESFGDCPARMTCVEQVWEAWWIKYMTNNLIFTMYAAHQVHCFSLVRYLVQIFQPQDAFAVDHREAGLHHKEARSADHSAVSSWEKEREVENLPDTPDFVGEMRRVVRPAASV